MKKFIKIAVIVLFFSAVVFLKIDDVVAEACYKHCMSNGKCSYFLSSSNDVATVVESACEEASNPTECKETKKNEYSIVDESFCDENYNGEDLLTCGNGMLKNIPSSIPKLIHRIYLVFQIVVPLILIILGSIDFVKSIIAQKEDEIKKGQQIFIKRLIVGVIIFFIFSIVKIVVSLVADNDKKINIINCASCFINNDENCED